MTREELKRNLNVDISWWEQSCYDEAMVILDKYLDEFENTNKQEEKDCPTCYHLGDNDYCEYCIRGEGYSKDYWELKI